MINTCILKAKRGLSVAFIATLIPGLAIAQGSAIGEIAIEGNVSIQRDGSSMGANSRDAVLDGDRIVTSGKQAGATVDLLEGGEVTMFGDSSLQLGQAGLDFATGGGCFSGLSAPIDVSFGGASVASGVTSGAVFNGVFYESCAQALAALETAGGGLSLLARSALVVGGVALAVEVTDDDPVHGN